jgi:PAS domain S-box-containing protein
MQTTGGLAVSVALLCVEDDETTRMTLHSALSVRYPEVEVYSAENGAEGLRLFNEHRPAIVLTDISMPVMDGIQMVAEIRRVDPETIIIAVTALSDSKDLLEAIQVGIDQFLLKPVNLVKLFETVSRHLETFALKAQVCQQKNRIRQLAMAVEQNPSSVLITDADGTIEYVNPRFSAVSGYAPDEVIGQNARILKSGLTPPETYADFWSTLTSGGIWQGELRNRTKSGETYWVSMVVSATFDDDNTLHYVAAREIITERKLAEQEHRSTIEMLRLVNSSTGIRDLISASAHFFRDQSACRAVGIRLREGEDYPYYLAQGFTGEFVIAENSLCSPDAGAPGVGGGQLIPALDGMCGKVISGEIAQAPNRTAHGSVWTNSITEIPAAGSAAEFCPRHRCQDEGYESIALIPLSVGSERLGLLHLGDPRKGAFTSQDINQWERLAGYLAIALLKIRAEASLQQLNEELERRVTDRTLSLESALREQESFSYSVSHDLRAPLRHINSYLAILSEDFGELLPAEAHAYLDGARTASRRMGKLIDDLLELSRVSRTNLVQETVNLSELAVTACSWLREGEPLRRVEIVITPAMTARGDKSLLRQMLVNLLGNAWKYTSTCPAARIEFGRELIGGQETFYVRDNGVGFDMAYSDKLFGEFERLHGPEYEGTGIGLATVKRIIDRHRGRVWAESRPGMGATFYFTLQ